MSGRSAREARILDARVDARGDREPPVRDRPPLQRRARRRGTASSAGKAARRASPTVAARR
jgi:hypothetical protein